MNSKLVRAVGVVGALFNLGGVQAYLAHVGMFGPDAAAVPAGSPALPVWVTSAFAIAVFAGVIGSVGLALLKRWARPVLWTAFVASVLNWGWVLTYSAAASVSLGVSVIVVSLLLAVVAQRGVRVG
ncbi:MAG: hypothetical protein V4659_07980 [Pseudomonadota bacterium]